MSESLGAERLPLAHVRKRIGRSQAEVAHLMRTTQSGVSRIERQDDVRVSTLMEYANALGGCLRVIMECEDRSFELAIGGVSGRSESEGLDPLEPWMTTSDVCNALGVSRRTVMTWKAAGRIQPAGKAGPGRGQLLWSRTDVARWAEELDR